MLTECPHCLTDVLVKRDGTCPACLRDVGNLSGANANITKIKIPNMAKGLPAVCVICGEAATQVMSFRRTVRNPHYQSRTSAVGVLGGTVGIFITWLFDFAAGNLYRELTIQLPKDAHIVEVN